MYYIDECGIDKYLYREYAYAPMGVRITGKINGKKFKLTNIVAAKCGCGGIVAPMIYGGTTDSGLFEYWFKNMLLKSILRHSVTILDNRYRKIPARIARFCRRQKLRTTFHRKIRLRELAEREGCDVLFLPPYSPDLNLIENFWAWLKNKLRSALPFYDNFDDDLLDCF